MTIEMWAALVGALLPALVSLVNREDWKSWIKGLIAFASSIIVGTVTALLGGEFTEANWVTSIGIVFGTSQVAYITWWKNTGISKKIEEKFNVVPEIEAAKKTEMEHSFPEKNK